MLNTSDNATDGTDSAAGIDTDADGGAHSADAVLDFTLGT